MHNGIDPGRLTAAERLAEIADILAAGLIRLKSRKSSHLSAVSGESSLDCAANQSSHADQHGGS